MSRILCAWELGENYGHMCDFLPLALTLRERGHEIIFALKDLSRAQVILGSYGFPLLQAPVWLPALTGFPMTPPLNYAEILHRVGFLDERGLNGMVKTWLQLYELVQPELLIINSGPTALLAASDTEIPDHDYGAMLEQLLYCSTFADGAKTFSDKHADFSQFRQIESMVKRCEEILGQE